MASGWTTSSRMRLPPLRRPRSLSTSTERTSRSASSTPAPTRWRGSSLQTASSPGDRVAVLLDRGPEAYAALFALMKVRATFVPLDANHPPERIGYVLRDAAVSLIVAHLQDRRPLRRLRIPRLILDKARRRDRGGERRAARRRRARPAGRGALLCSLHFGHDRPPQRGRSRASQHLQFRPRRGGALRFRSGRSRLSGHVARLRLLGRGALGSTPRRRDDRFPTPRQRPSSTGSSPTSLSRARNLPVLRADPARLHRARFAEAAYCCLSAAKPAHQPSSSAGAGRGGSCSTATARPRRRLPRRFGRLSPDRPVTIGRPLPTYSIAILDPVRDEALAVANPAKSPSAELASPKATSTGLS